MAENAHENRGVRARHFGPHEPREEIAGIQSNHRAAQEGVGHDHDRGAHHRRSFTNFEDFQFSPA